MREFAPRTAALLAMLLATQLAHSAEYELRVQPGWNLISVTRSGSSLNGLIGDAINLPGFCFQRGQYVAIDRDQELQPGLGYWVYAYRNLRILQDSEAARAATVVPVELAVWNLVGVLPASPGYATLNDLAWEWRPPRYRGIRPAQMQVGTGYSIYPDPDQVQLAISQIDPVSPLPGTTVTLTATGAQYLAGGGVVWFGNVPTPIIAADSANSIRVLAPLASGTIGLVLDAGHGITSAPFSITMPSQTSALELESDLLDLASTVIDTLNREHGASQAANIAIAEAQLLGLIDQLELAPSARVLLENAQVASQLALLKSDIAARNRNPSAAWANIQQTLLWLDSYTLPQQLARLCKQQLSEILATGDPDAILNWQAFDTLAEIIQRAHELTNWVPTRLTGFRVDRSLCDSPLSCQLGYFADFALDDGARKSLAEERTALLKSLPADFAIANSASAIQNASGSPPADLLITRNWNGIQIDMQWMVDQGRGFRDAVFSSSLSECGIPTFRVEPIANSLSLQVIAQAAGFGRLDSSVFDRDRALVFTANTDLTVRPDIILFPYIPTVASPGPFFDDPTDTVHSIDYRVVIEPTLPLPAECFVPGIRFSMDVAEPNLRISEATTQTVATGLEIRQAYVLEPGLRPTLEQTRVQAYAGTTTFIPLSVSGFNLPAASFEAALFVDDARDFLRETERAPILLPYDLPMASAFNNAIAVNVLSANLGTADVFATAPLSYSMNYQALSAPGTTDVVTVFVGVNGIGEDDSSNPPNARIQELIVDLIQAPLRVQLHQSVVYDGSSIAFTVDREFDVALLPEEVSQLQFSVDPADDISLANGSMELARETTPGIRSLTVNLGNEQASVQFEVLEDVLFAFLLSDTVYAGTAAEFGYSLASGDIIPNEDLGISILPSEDITVNDNFLEVAAGAAAGQRTLTVSYGVKSASATFTVIQDVLSMTPDAPAIFEGNSLTFSFTLESGEVVANPVISVTPPDDITITGPEVSVAFGAAPGPRTLSVTAGAVTADTTLTIVDDALLLTADEANAFVGSEISLSVARLSGAALVGSATLSVLPADDITVNGLTLEIADSATPGTRTVTAELGADSASIDIEILGDPVFIAIDLSAGPDAANYPVSTFQTVPAPLPEVYKTTSILLRRVANRSFTMGSPAGELGHQANEAPHSVTFSSHSYIGVVEVTQRQWELVTGQRPSLHAPQDYENFPVENVSYDDIRGTQSTWPASSDVASDSFIGRLRARSGIALDLPTEAQWENACRAGTTTALNDGSNLQDLEIDPSLDLLGRYANNANGSSGPVAEFQPNVLGLYDMHGNVWEWCLDWFGLYSGAETDPVGAISGSKRIMRGGSYLLGAHYTRSARRGQLAPGSVNSFIGLRVAAPASATP